VLMCGRMSKNWMREDNDVCDEDDAAIAPMAQERKRNIARVSTKH
jgi:hypothetical protein